MGFWDLSHLNGILQSYSVENILPLMPKACTFAEAIKESHTDQTTFSSSSNKIFSSTGTARDILLKSHILGHTDLFTPTLFPLRKGYVLLMWGYRSHKNLLPKSLKVLRLSLFGHSFQNCRKIPPIKTSTLHPKPPPPSSSKDFHPLVMDPTYLTILFVIDLYLLQLFAKQKLSFWILASC